MLFADDIGLKNILPLSELKSKDAGDTYRESVFGQNNIVVIEGRTHYGDGVFPVIADHKKTIVIQMGYTYAVIYSAIRETMRIGTSDMVSEYFAIRQKSKKRN